MGKRLTFEQVPEAVAQLLEEMAEIKKLLKAQPAPAKTEKMSGKSIATRTGKASGKSAAIPGEIGIDEVCVILKRSKQTVYALVKSGKLKPRKQGNKLFFIKEEVEGYAASPDKSARGRKKATPAAKATPKAKTSSKSAPVAETKAKADTKVTRKAKAKIGSKSASADKTKSKATTEAKAEAAPMPDLQATATPEATAASAKSGDKKLRFPRFGKTGGKGTSRTQKPPKPEAAASAPESQNPPEETK